MVAHEWLMRVFEPVVRAVPSDLRGKLEPAEVFHQLLEHRWFLFTGAALLHVVLHGLFGISYLIAGTVSVGLAIALILGSYFFLPNEESTT